MKKILSALLLVSLVNLLSCTDQKVNKEFNREGEELSVTVKVSDDIEADAFKYHNNLMGQALYSPDDNLCDIVVDSKLSISEQQKTLGHELMHCLYGNYHK